MCFVIPADLIQSLRYKGRMVCVSPLNTCPLCVHRTRQGLLRQWQRRLPSSFSGNDVHTPATISTLMMFSHCKRMMSLIRNPVRQEKRAADLITGFSQGVFASIFTSSRVRNSRFVLASLACFSRGAIFSLIHLPRMHGATRISTCSDCCWRWKPSSCSCSVVSESI